jgi:hypothetical protein
MKTRLFFRTVLCSIVFAAVFAVGVSAQTQSQNPDGIPTTPGSVRVYPAVNPVDHEQVIAYWTSETGWKSELQLRNNLADQDLTVTPKLRLADGAETALTSVTIKPQEVKSVDLDSAISAVSAPHLSALTARSFFVTTPVAIATYTQQS